MSWEPPWPGTALLCTLDPPQISLIQASLTWRSKIRRASVCQPYRGQADKPDGLDSGSPLHARARLSSLAPQVSFCELGLKVTVHI